MMRRSVLVGTGSALPVHAVSNQELSERIDTTSAAGKMVFRMLAVLAEFERDLQEQRTPSAAVEAIPLRLIL